VKNLVAILLAATLLGACSKKEADPQPVPATPPAQAAGIDVKFDYYATGSTPATTRSMSLLADKPTWKQSSDRLTITLEKLDVLSSVQDRVELTIPLAKQKAGLVGTYVLASQPNTSLGEALFNYVRPGSNSAYSNVYSSNGNQVAGSMVITSYDAKRQLISGSYNARFTNVKGPFSFLGVGSVGDPRLDGDLTLSGTFQEIPLK
jgi:hypothetical protein